MAIVEAAVKIIKEQHEPPSLSAAKNEITAVIRRLFPGTRAWAIENEVASALGLFANAFKEWTTNSGDLTKAAPVLAALGVPTTPPDTALAAATATPSPTGQPVQPTALGEATTE